MDKINGKAAFDRCKPNAAMVSPEMDGTVNGDGDIAEKGQQLTK